LNRYEDIFIDMEAGIEHLGRGTAQSVDKFLIVMEPNHTSINTAKKIKQLAENLKIKEVFAIGNKIRSESDKNFIEKNIKDIKLKGFISVDEELLNSRGKLPENSKFIDDLKEVYNGIRDNG
ncbi:MAG: carbon monoxide dehydrogenase, partial [Candidatus Omnitrophota bacterium]|nr:carbon monoxide dehydrogenase [Candidatus Omnitrophota bacterium]